MITKIVEQIMKTNKNKVGSYAAYLSYYFHDL